jgi:uncharacterized membrane protein YdjX (TVP38/TMEM64 family)
MAETTPAPANKRALLLKLAAVVVVLGVAALLVLRGVDVKGLVQRALETVQHAGPLVFFGAMAVLPAIGAPLSPFSLTAGSIFGEQLGMPLVITYALLAVTLNIVGTYFLASRAFRPLLEKLVTRLGYRLPEVAAGDAADLIILLRVTPGVPFPAQNYLLGLARVPFVKYAVISCVIQWAFNAAFILFGDAVLHGRGKLALLGFSALLALTAGTHLVRKHYERRKKAA